MLHLGDEVEVVTDRFVDSGAPRGAIGTIVDDWADGSNDVEISDAASGDVVARVRAAPGEIVAHAETEPMKQPREHGILFGRGDDLGAPAGDPPFPPGSQFGGMPWGGTTGPWFGGERPPEDGQLAGDTPWVLTDEPPSGPIFH